MRLDTQLVQLMQLAGVDVVVDSGGLYIVSTRREVHLELGPWSLMFLCMWAGIHYRPGSAPKWSTLFADTAANARTGDLRELKTCYTGSVPFGNYIPRDVARVLTGLLCEQTAFYASFHDKDLTGEVCAIIRLRGLSWGKTGDTWVVSNSLGSATGLPPNPVHLRIPSFRSVLRLRPGLLCGLGTPRRRRGAIRNLCDVLREGYSTFVRKPTAKNLLFVRDLVLLTGSRPSSTPSDWGRLRLTDFASCLSQGGAKLDWIVENLYNIGVSVDGIVFRM